jgi:uncharacterized protein (TIGR02996 family)
MSEMDRAVFLQAIQADPADVTARLAWADFLDDRDDPDGELIRLICEVQASGYIDSPAWRRLKDLTDQLVVQIGQLCERDQRLLVCDCADRVLRLVEGVNPVHGRLRRVVQTARRHAVGAATDREMEKVRIALQVAVGEALVDADTPVTSNVVTAIAGAAWDDADGFRGTACDAARDAIGCACGDTAREAEHRWQLCRAVEYRLRFLPLPSFEE